MADPRTNPNFYPQDLLPAWLKGLFTAAPKPQAPQVPGQFLGNPTQPSQIGPAPSTMSPYEQQKASMSPFARGLYGGNQSDPGSVVDSVLGGGGWPTPPSSPSPAFQMAPLQTPAPPSPAENQQLYSNEGRQGMWVTSPEESAALQQKRQMMNTDSALAGLAAAQPQYSRGW